MFKFIISLIVFFTFSVSAQTKTKPNIKPIDVSISPSGEIETAEQVRLDFSEAVIRLGEDQNSVTPADSNCFTDENEEPRGQGYWTDEKTWVFNFTKPAPTNTVCKIRMRTDFKSYNGKAVNLDAVAEFKTLTAQIVKIFPGYYDSISENQYFLVRLNGKADPNWIEKNAYFTVKNLGDKIKVLILSDKEKENLFHTIKESDSGLNWYLESIYEPAENEGQFKVNMQEWLAIKADRPFPRNSSIVLNWLDEIQFDVKQEFKALFNCERETSNSACVPISNMTVNFSDEISGSDIKKIYLQKSDGTKIFPKEIKNTHAKAGLNYLTFEGPFSANSSYTLNIEKIKSLDGETLVNQNAFPLKVSTAQPPSLLKVDRLFSVIEASNPVLPIHVRNVEAPLSVKNFQTILPGKSASIVLTSAHVEKIIDTLKSAHSALNDKPLLNPSAFKTMNFKVPKKFPNDKTEVVGIPLKQKGLHFIEFQSQLLGQKLNYEPQNDPLYYVRSLALVTDLNITLKFSNNEVLAWVTSLDKANPIFNAEVALVSNGGKVIKTQMTNQAGLAYFKLSPDEARDLNTRITGAYGAFSYGFFAFAKLKDDFSFVWSNDDQGLESYRFGLNLPYEDKEIIYHAILERNLLQPKEKLRAKLIYRKVEENGLSIPNLTLPAKIEIRDTIVGKRHLIPVKWYPNEGTGTFEWVVPEGAQVGFYKISFPTKENNPEDDSQFSAPENEYGNEQDEISFGSFNVEEFKIPNISTTVRGLDTPWINVKEPQIEFSAQYLSGGPAAGLPVKFRYSIENSSLYLNDEELKEFEWQRGSITEGVTKHNRKSSQNLDSKKSQFIDVKLDKFGRYIFKIKGIESKIQQQVISVNFEYKDANGEIKTLSRSYDMLGTDTLIGIKSTSWYQTNDDFGFEVKVIDPKFQALPDKSVKMSLYKVDNFSTRKKLLGGFYSYESYEEIKKIRDLCSGKTDAKGRFFCKGSDKSLSGEYLILAETKDISGKNVTTKISTYLSGGEYWFGGSDSDRMDLIPTKKQYEPGETAEFQIRGPITEGQLLVTVERSGVLYRIVHNFSQKEPFIKLRVSEDWAPNVVVSATLIRGRTNGEISGTLDLGKPSLKMGMTSIKVGLKKHLLKVSVSPDKTKYEPREQVSLSVDVKNLSDSPVNGEIAVAVIDEGLLQLKENNTWNLSEIFLSPRAHKVKTAYLISHVIGKRTLGLKAVPSGGDGAGMRSRELFDSSLYWNPRIRLVNGKANVKFKALDSLTGYRVVVIAHNQADQFGLGSSHLTVSKEVQAFSGLALAVRKGDSYDARFTVRNSTEKNKNLKVDLLVNNQIQKTAEVQLNSNESRELIWPITAAEDKIEQIFELKVTENSRTVDRLLIKQPILPVWPLRSFGNTLKQDTNLKVDIGLMEKSTQTELHLTALPALSTDLPSIKNFWANYNYDCFEQRFSRALQTDNKKLFDELMKISNSYLDSDGLIKYFPNTTYGSVFLTNFILQASYYKNWKLDEAFESAALEALISYFSGKLNEHAPYNKKYETYSKLETLDTLLLYDKIDPEQLSSLDLNYETLPNNYVAHLISILKNQKLTDQNKAKLDKAIQIVKGRTNLSSIRMTIRDNQQSDIWGFYLNEDQSEAKLLIQLFEQEAFKADGGRLLLGFLERAKTGYWYNTMANTWALLALNKYKTVFEKTPVNGELNWGITDNLVKTELNKFEKRLVLPIKQNTTAISEFKGQGSPWINFLVLSNPPLTSNRMRGINIEKSWKPIEVKDEKLKSVGDIWEITLKINSKSEFQWLAVRDPIPPGAIVVDEEGASISAKKAVEYQIFENWFYAEPKTYKYKIRLNQSGTYQLPTTIAEAMYDRDLNAELLNGNITILP